MATVTTKSLGKTYPNGFEAVKDLDLELEDGEFLVLVGPSGCGKSTALRMIAGLEDISSGELYIGDNLANDVAPKDRDIAMVFQNYALYPHMTVRENIAFALKLAKVDRDEIDRRVNDAAKILELDSNLDRKPAQLSGGQRQRVAMGRAIVRKPAAFLMDEPLSNLDAKLRVQMRAEIARIQKNLGTTTLYVTHDQVEAMTMADRVAVLSAGVLQQVDSPETLYDHPANRFVASFIGSPPMNMFSARLDDANGGMSVQLGSQTVDIPADVVAAKPAVRAYAGKPVIFGIRPEDLEDRAVAGEGLPTIQANVALVEALGAEQVVHLGLDAEAAASLDPDTLEGIGLKESEEAQSMPVGRFSPRSGVTEGERIEVSVDAARVHFFDPDTGLAITT